MIVVQNTAVRKEYRGIFNEMQRVQLQVIKGRLCEVHEREFNCTECLVRDDTARLDSLVAVNLPLVGN